MNGDSERPEPPGPDVTPSAGPTRGPAERDFARSIVETVRHPLVVLDAELRVVSANAAFYKTFRVAPAETVGHLVYDLGNRQWDLPELRVLLNDILPKNGTVSDYEVAGTFPTIGHRAMFLNARRLVEPVLPEGGHILLAIEDITDRRRAEQALRRSEERFRRIINIDGVGVLTFDAAGRLIDANDFFLHMFGYSRSEIAAGSLTWRHLTPPEHTKVSEQQLRALAATGRIGPYEKEYLRKDGSRSWMVFAGAALGDGTVVEYCIDVSARKRAEDALRVSEERFRLVLDSATDFAIFTLDPLRRVTTWSPGAQIIFGYAGHEVLGAPVDLLYTPEDRADAVPEREVWEAERNGRAFDERWHVRKDGTRFFASGVLTPLDRAGARGYVKVLRDQTARKRAADALRASDELQRLLLDHAPVALAMFDRDMRYLAVSRRWVTDYRLQGRELLGRSHYDVFPEIPERWRAAHARGLAGEFTQVDEDRFERADGSTQWVRWELCPWHDATGAIRGIVIFTEDITDRKAAEATLKASVELQRAVLASLTAHLAVLDRTGRIIAVNPAWEAFGREHGGLPKHCGIGANYLEACRTATGTDAPQAHQIGEAIRAVLDGTSDAYSTEYSCDTSTGPRWFLLQVTPLRLGAEGAVVSHTDITGRKEAELERIDREARLSAILNTAADAIVSIDRRGTIERVNMATERLFGYSAEEMVGQNVSLLMPAPYRDEHDQYIARYLSTGQPRIIGTGREVTARRKDGTVFPVDLAVSEIDHQHKFTGIVRDATRRKMLEREVVEIASLEQQRIGTDLHDSAGQELTALNMLAGDLADTLRAESSAARPIAEKLAQGLQRCQRELRVVIRGLVPVPVEKEGLMAALSELADRINRDSKVACVFDCPDPVSVADNLTATHLYRIAQEAVHNAVKHAAPRLVRITLLADHHLILRVEDDGAGLAPAPTEPGVGMRIMRNRAAILGARLTVEPGVPTGTVITCELLGNRS